MPGDGTKAAAGRADAPPPARLLDITRLCRRAGRCPTGIDRVELAYLDRLTREAVPVFGLARLPFGYVLLDREGLLAIAARCRGEIAWGPANRLSRLGRHRVSDAVARARADLRRLALARRWPPGLAGMLGQHLPHGTSYLNVGHSNLTPRVLTALRRIRARVTVMVHDTIPLDHPEFQRDGAPERFAGFLSRVVDGADLVLANSHATAADLRRHLGAATPEVLVSHLGVSVAQPDPAGLPEGAPPPAPYFVTLGTIEPRKNHALLLDIWETLAREVPEPLLPQLVICGARGWNNEALFARLDASPLAGRVVHEYAGLDDGAIAALLAGSAGLLFPSRAEGYGLPPLEALALGVPVLCGNLPVCHELLGEMAVYADVDDPYSWRRAIVKLAQGARTGRHGNAAPAQTWRPPDWTAHFNSVLSRA